MDVMRLLGPSSLSVLFGLSVLLVGAEARADVIDPAEQACGEPGTACTLDGKAGACVKDTCTKLVYGGAPAADGKGQPERQHGPRTVNYDCARCVPGATPADGGADASKSETKSETKSSSCSVDVGPTTVTSLLLGLGLLGFVSRRRA